MKKLLSIAVFALAAIQLLNAQSNGVCGNSTESQRAIQPRSQENIAKAMSGLGATDRDVIQYVPIHFILVGDSLGNGRVNEVKILDQLCDQNEAYAPMNIRFYLAAHPTYGLFNKSIANNNVMNNQNNSILMKLRKSSKALNVFVVATPNSGPSASPGIVLAYYSPQFDWVVERKTEVKGGHSGTLPHEVGHFFSLMHTFYGWESNPFSPDDAGWPIAPAVSPGGIATERVNGTNCLTAADGICDTPPDYNFGLDQGNCLPYTQGAKDPLGTPVDPMEINFMSYFSGCDTAYKFTPIQQSTILADLSSSSRNFLDNTFSPLSTEITVPAGGLMTAPLAGITTTYYDEVMFEWQAVAGANHYLIEADITPTFATSFYRSVVTTGTSQLLTSLVKNKTYYWRVRPFNEYVTCPSGDAAAFLTFKTSTISATKNVSELNAWQISPNPASTNGVVTLRADSKQSFVADLSIIDATGRRLYTQQNVDFQTGESTVELPLNGIANGLYYVLIESEKGRDVRKLTVQN
ncbi:MAG: T9SS type A sorting domain-containing protein [Bacteroidota bacterium]